MRKLFSVVYSERKPLAVKAAEHVKKILESRGFGVYVCDARRVVEEKVPAEAEAVIVLGGDGTLLRTLRGLSNPETPLLTVNYGKGGYLMEVEPKDLEEAVEALLRGEYLVEEVMQLSFQHGGVRLGEALNEAYISTSIPGKVAELRVEKEGSTLMETEADGVVVATPIGSTAYAYSAGGPVVDEKLEAAVLVPVCPLGHVRAMVLALDSAVHVSMESEEEVQILFDGHFRRVFPEGRLRLEVKASERRVRFIRVKGGGSFARRVWKRFG